MYEKQQDEINDSIPSRPQKLHLELVEKKSYTGTDIESFKFAYNSVDNKQNQSLRYKAGQFAIVDLGTKDDPEGPMRSFTLASSPTEKNFIMICTRIRDTLFKKKLASLEVGTSVNITAPLGKFILHEDYSNPAVLLSGGIGVTPFRSMIKYVTDMKLPVKIIMFDSNRNRSNILFKKEFDEWTRINKNLKIIYTISEKDQNDNEQSLSLSSSSTVVTENDWKGEYGRINKAMILKYIDINVLNNSIFYICGPPGMLKAMQKLLQADLSIPKQRIRTEEFTGY
jgi:ferredoxin-NADP reductase